MGLIVRDECERSVRNQALKVESMDRDWLVSSLREATRKKATCRAHDWKMKSHARLSFLCLSRKKGQPTKDLRKSLFGKKLCFALPSLYLHYIYSHYPQSVSAF